MGMDLITARDNNFFIENPQIYPKVEQSFLHDGQLCYYQVK